MRIRNQVFLIFFLFMILIVIIGFYAVRVGEGALERLIDKETSSQARGMMDTVDKAIFNRTEIFKAYTSDLIFQDALREANQKQKLAGNQSAKSIRLVHELEEKLEYYEKRYGYPIFNEVVVVNRNKTAVAYAGASNHAKTLQRTAFRDKIIAAPVVETFQNGDILLYDSFPVLDEATDVIGYLFLSMNLRDVVGGLKASFHKGVHALHDTMHYTLLDAKNRVIYSTSALLPGTGATRMIRKNKTSSAASVTDIVHDAKSERQYVYVSSLGYLDFKGLGWKMVIQHDLKEVFAPVDRLKYTVGAAMLVMLLLALLTAFITSRLIVRPITLLTRAAAKISEGELDAGVAISGYGEIGNLIEAFNHMGRELKKSQLELVGEIKKNKAATLALRDNDERLMAITDSAQDGILMIDNKQRIVFANPAATTILGYEKGELLSRNVHGLIAPERFRNAYEKGFAAFKNTGEGPVIGKTLELFARHKDGHEIPVELSVSSVYYKGSWHAIGIIRDISERKSAEEALKKQEEMMIAQSRQAAMGDMIAMIAHQWRQPITVVAMAANNIKLKIELGESITKEDILHLVDTTTKQTQHVSKTIDDFRNFFKPNKKQTRCKVENIVTDTLNIIGKSLENNNIALSVTNRSHRKILTYSNELLQVYLNLIGNAKDALVETEPSDARISVHIVEEGDEVKTVICDNGGGIAKQAIGRIGEPYVSTKVESGTGLGLYMSKTIIEKHLHGRLEWENKNMGWGMGACFTVILPLEPEDETLS